MRKPDDGGRNSRPKPQIRDGASVKDAGGRVAYTVMSFTSRAVADAFSARVVDAILDSFPRAFEPQRAAS